MVRLLPAGGFQWVNKVSKFTSKKIYRLSKHGGRGLMYRKELHNDLPFMCEKMVINKVEKLGPNLHDKRNYIIHKEHQTKLSNMG